MSQNPSIITELPSLKAFSDLLAANQGLIIIKFGAEWCGPCKKIEGLVNEWFHKISPTVQCIKIDIDEHLDVYAFLKNKRVLNGIPAILSYVKGNTHYGPNDLVVGSDVNQINAFFNRS